MSGTAISRSDLRHHLAQVSDLGLLRSCVWVGAECVRLRSLAAQGACDPFEPAKDSCLTESVAAGRGLLARVICTSLTRSRKSTSSVCMIRTCRTRRSAFRMTWCRSSTGLVSRSPRGLPINSAVMPQPSRRWVSLSSCWSTPISLQLNLQRLQSRQRRWSAWNVPHRGSEGRGVLDRSRQAPTLCGGLLG